MGWCLLKTIEPTLRCYGCADSKQKPKMTWLMPESNVTRNRLGGQKNRIHGHARSTNKPPHPMYQAWVGIICRCTNPQDRRYKNYGARGISVCDRWRKYINFLADMGPTWRLGLTIERIDNDGGYCPENCTWATRLVQQNNRRSNRFLTYDGRTMTVAQWERHCGFKPTLIYSRLKAGWTVECAIRLPPSPLKHPPAWR